MSTWAQHRQQQGCIQMQCRGVRLPGCGAQSAGILIVTASLSRIPEGEHTFYVNMKKYEIKFKFEIINDMYQPR